MHGGNVGSSKGFSLFLQFTERGPCLVRARHRKRGGGQNARRDEMQGPWRQHPVTILEKIDLLQYQHDHRRRPPAGVVVLLFWSLKWEIFEPQTRVTSQGKGFQGLEGHQHEALAYPHGGSQVSFKSNLAPWQLISRPCWYKFGHVTPGFWVQ